MPNQHQGKLTFQLSHNFYFECCSLNVIRLLVKVLNEEMKRAQPFSHPSVDIKRLLLAIDSFFCKHPVALSGDDTPFCSTKTLLSQIVSTLGGQVVLNLYQSMDIGSTAFVYRYEGSEFLI